jgi:transcriptional regulator with PAS, ATPase and Fis domain
VDVRVIATTNRNLQESVDKKEFREDLYFRLNVVPIVLPPLRDRKGDVPLLAEQFRQRFARKHGMEVVGISANCMAALKRHSWPGNVRELQNVIERAVILCSEGGVLEIAHLGLTERPHPAAGMPSSTGDGGEFLTMSEMEKRHVLAALERSKGNRTQAAKMLDISIRTLRNKLHEYNMQSQGDAAEEADEAGSEQPAN